MTNKNKQSTYIPKDIYLYLTTFLRINELAKLSYTCRKWRDIYYTSSVWKYKCEYYYNKCELVKFNNNYNKWKALYLYTMDAEIIKINNKEHLDYDAKLRCVQLLVYIKNNVYHTVVNKFWIEEYKRRCIIIHIRSIINVALWHKTLHNLFTDANISFVIMYGYINNISIWVSNNTTTLYELKAISNVFTQIHLQNNDCISDPIWVNGLRYMITLVDSKYLHAIESTITNKVYCFNKKCSIELDDGKNIYTNSIIYCSSRCKIDHWLEYKIPHICYTCNNKINFNTCIDCEKCHSTIYCSYKCKNINQIDHLDICNRYQKSIIRQKLFKDSIRLYCIKFEKFILIVRYKYTGFIRGFKQTLAYKNIENTVKHLLDHNQ